MDHYFSFVIYFMLVMVIVRLLFRVKWRPVGNALFRDRNVARVALLSIPLILFSVFFLDAPVRILFATLHSHPADVILYWFNLAGDGVYLYPLLVIYLFFTLLFLDPKQSRFALMLLLSVLLAGLLTLILKNIILRVRPFLTDDPLRFFVFLREGFHLSLFNTGNNSFPSGHTTNAFAFWTPILLRVKNSWLRLVLFILPLMTAVSRIYLNKHWFTDVLAGALLGLWVGFAITKAFGSSNDQLV